MFFDDRLATVLRQRGASETGLRTQFRQLLDILGAERVRADSARDHSLVAAAWLRMDALAEKIPAEARARMIRETGWRFRNPQLAAHLADFEPEVASAALNRAQLSAEDWTALIPRLPVRARGFLRLRRDLPVDVEKLLERLGVHDRGLPQPVGVLDELVPGDEDTLPEPPVPPLLLDEEAPPPHDFASDLVVPETEADVEPEPEPEPEAPLETPTPAAPPPVPPRPEPALDDANDPQAEGRSEISALVERIAQFRRTRDGTPIAPGADQPRLPLGETVPSDRHTARAFGFAADAGGRIEWADAEVAAMVIGTRLVAPARLGASAQSSALERAFTRRQPIISAPMSLAGAEAIAGDWVLDAQPRFTEDGNFSGYVGRFRRPASTGQGAPSAAQREADRIRQLLHELRTPVTAVQGYAEVIQQQLFGQAPHEYRALAAAIAADAARILAGFEELDRLARLETGAVRIEAGETEFATFARRTAAQLAQVLAPRMAGIELAEDDASEHLVAVDENDVEAMLWRLLATLGGGCAAGEMLDAEIVEDKGFVRMTCDLPAQLLGEEDIFTAEARPIGHAINAGLFGAGFALRLARAEARASGGDLVRDDERIALTLPLADISEQADTQLEP